jgi:hypothetical protein
VPIFMGCQPDTGGTRTGSGRFRQWDLGNLSELS